MTSLLTSSAANAARTTIRQAQALVEETQQRIGTGLKVRSAADQPAFFGVSQSLLGDSIANKGIAENLAISRNAIRTGEAAVSQVSDLLNEIREALLVADTGIALEEAQTALEGIRSEIVGAIRSASFGGINFLATDIQRQVIGSLTNGGGTTDINYFLIEGAGLDTRRASSSISSLGSGEPNPTTPEEFAAVEILPILEAAYDPALLPLFDLNGDGVYTVNGSAANGDDFSSRFGRQISEAAYDGLLDAIARMNAVGFGIRARDLVFGANNGPQPNPANPAEGNSITFRANGSVPTQFRIDINGDGNPNSNNVTLPIAGGGFRDINSPREFINELILDDTLLNAIRATVDSITPPASDPPLTFVQRLNTINIVDGLNTEAGLAILDDLQQELNLAGAKLGVVARRIDLQVDFSRALVNSLDQGVAALTEADLDEESARLQAFLAQEQLALQSLSIVNSRLGERLALFNNLLGPGSIAGPAEGTIDARI